MEPEQSTSIVLMVKPTHFGFDPETAQSNTFQKQLHVSNQQIAEQVEREFNGVVHGLRFHQIEVIAAGDDNTIPAPSAVFPNNWISTWPNGQIYLYPMAQASRRHERSSAVVDILKHNFKVNGVTDLSDNENRGIFLESTGSIIFDHQHRLAYCCLSPRSNKQLFEAHAQSLGYRPISFHAESRGAAIYHTNVMMGIQSSTAVICASAITSDNERTAVTEVIKSSGHTLVDISKTQMLSFCGNILELHNPVGERFLVMSQSAFNVYTPNQRAILAQDKQILAFAIPTLETLGGGSIRCMLAEVFLPRTPL